MMPEIAMLSYDKLLHPSPNIVESVSVRIGSGPVLYPVVL